MGNLAIWSSHVYAEFNKLLYFKFNQESYRRINQISQQVKSMVKTRQQCQFSTSSSQEAENKRNTADSPVQNKSTTIFKEKKIGKDVLRDSVRSKMARKRQRKAKIINYQHQMQIWAMNSQIFNCPICLQYFLQPILTPCGHTFCLHCIEQSLRHKNSCSLCRKTVTIDEPISSKIFKDIIRKVSFKFLSKEESQEYDKRMEAFALKEDRRKIDFSIQQGDLVDLHLERSWHEGQVIEIKQQMNHKILKIRAVHDKTIIRELEIRSRQIAKFRTFTKEKPNLNFVFLTSQFNNEFFNSISNNISFFLEQPYWIQLFEMEAI